MHLQPPRREATVCLLRLSRRFLVPRRGDASRAGAAPPQPGGCGVWWPPVDGPVARSFQAPAFAYGPGHRGIDFAVPPGTPVRASGDGVVALRRLGRRLFARRRRPRRQSPHDVRASPTSACAPAIASHVARSSAPPAAPAPSTRPAGSISASASATAISIRSACSACAISRNWSASSLPTRCRPSRGTRSGWSPGRSPREGRASQRSLAISPAHSAMPPGRPSTPGAAVGTPWAARSERRRTALARRRRRPWRAGWRELRVRRSGIPRPGSSRRWRSTSPPVPPIGGITARSAPTAALPPTAPEDPATSSMAVGGIDTAARRMTRRSASIRALLGYHRDEVTYFSYAPTVVRTAPTRRTATCSEPASASPSS